MLSGSQSRPRKREVDAVRGQHAQCRQHARRLSARQAQRNDQQRRRAGAEAEKKLRHAEERPGLQSHFFAFFSRAIITRSSAARVSKLSSGVTSHLSNPQNGISRSIRSSFSFDSASATKTKARSPTLSPPARMRFSDSSRFSASRLGRTRFSNNWSASSAVANPGPSKPV